MAMATTVKSATIALRPKPKGLSLTNPTVNLSLNEPNCTGTLRETTGVTEAFPLTSRLPMKGPTPQVQVILSR